MRQLVDQPLLVGQEVNQLTHFMTHSRDMWLPPACKLASLSSWAGLPAGPAQHGL